MIPTVIDILDTEGNVIGTKRVNEERVDNSNSKFNLFDSYKAIAITNKSVLNTDVYEFHERFADIFSEMVMKDNRYLLSPEQKEMIDRYFSTAPDSTGISKTEDDIYAILSDNDLIQLDKFLGGI